LTTSLPCSGKQRRSRLLASCLILTVTGALAAEPCPWEKSAEQAGLCGEWNALAQRLEAAEERALAAEAKLEAVLGAATPGAAVPEPATGPRAARSRRIIRRVLDGLGGSVLDLGKFETSPDMVLTQEGNRYRAVFATAAWRLTSTRVDFGPLEFVIEPLDDTLAKVVVGLGEVITVRRGDQLIARLTIGTQETGGIWNEEIGGFAEANLTLKRLGLRLTGQPVSGEIGTLHLSHTLERLDDATWIGQRTRQADGLLSHLEASLTITDLNMERSGEPLAKLTRMSATTRLDEKLGSGSTFHFTLALDGLQPLQSALPAELLPITGQLDLGVAEIPPGYMAQMVEIGLAGEQIQDEAAKDAYWRREYTRLLRNTPMSLIVQDSFVATPRARADLTLRAALDPAAALGGKGDLTLRIEALQSIIDDSNASEQPGLASLLALLTVFSERSEASGRIVDSYRIRVTEDGKLWLNGKDVSALFLPSRSRP
jgi:hypothetical protein